MPIEHLEYRRALWLHVMGLLKTVHRHRLPGRRFGPDLELLAVYGTAMVVRFSRGRLVGSTDIANYLGMPRETVRRNLNRLASLGLLEREARKFRLSPSTEEMPEDVVQILSDQVASAATLAKLGRQARRALIDKKLVCVSREMSVPQDEMTSLMDSPALLWVCKPDGSGMIHNAAWCEHYGMSLEQAVTGWMNTPHPDDKPALLEPWLKSLTIGTPYEAEVRRRDRTGEYHWYRTRAVPVFKNGKIVKWSGVNTEFHPRLR